jgi:hypothetical protein
VRCLAAASGFLFFLTACGAENGPPAAVTTQTFAAFCADLARLERLGERGTGTAADLRAFAVGSLAAIQSASAKAPASLRSDVESVAAFYGEFHEFAERIEFDPTRLETAPDSRATVDQAVAASERIEAFAAERCPREYDIL